MGSVGSVDIEELKRARQQLNQERGIETDPDMYKNYNPNRAKEESEMQQNESIQAETSDAESSYVENDNSNTNITDNSSLESDINAENLSIDKSLDNLPESEDSDDKVEIESSELQEDEDDEDFDIGNFFDKLLSNNDEAVENIESESASDIVDDEQKHNSEINLSDFENNSQSSLDSSQNNVDEENDIELKDETVNIAENDSFSSLKNFDLQNNNETSREPLKVNVDKDNSERDFSVYDNFAEFEVKGYENKIANSEGLISENNENSLENKIESSFDDNANITETVSESNDSEKEELLKMMKTDDDIESSNVDVVETNNTDNTDLSETTQLEEIYQNDSINSNAEIESSQNIDENIDDNFNENVSENNDSTEIKNSDILSDEKSNEIPLSKDVDIDENAENPFIRLDTDVIITDREEISNNENKSSLNEETKESQDLENKIVENFEEKAKDNQVGLENNSDLDDSQDNKTTIEGKNFKVEESNVLDDINKESFDEISNNINYDIENDISLSDLEIETADENVATSDEEDDADNLQEDSKKADIDYFKKIDDYSFVDVLQTEEFKSSDNLSYLFGKDEEGRLMFMNMRDMFNTAIFGTDEQAIFAYISSMLLSLSLKNTVNDVNFVICDSKLQSDFEVYNKSSYMFFNRVAKTNREILDTLAELENELEERYNTLVEVGAKNIEHYNKFATDTGISPLPYIIVVFNNYTRATGLMLGEQINICLANLLKLGRIVGVYAVVSASEAIDSRDVNLNLSGRIAFKTDSEDLSDFEVGTNDAVRLIDSKEFVYTSVKGDEIFHLKTAKLTKNETDLILENLEN